MENIVNDIMETYHKTPRFGSDPFALVQKINQGVSYSEFENIFNSHPFTIIEWAGFLHLSERTIARYKIDNKHFDGPQSERIIQIYHLYIKGLEVFDNKENLNIWFNSPNISLGGLIPKQLLNSTYGIEILTNELTRIAYGVLA